VPWATFQVVRCRRTISDVHSCDQNAEHSILLGGGRLRIKEGREADTVEGALAQGLVVDVGGPGVVRTAAVSGDGRHVPGVPPVQGPTPEGRRGGNGTFYFLGGADNHYFNFSGRADSHSSTPPPQRVGGGGLIKGLRRPINSVYWYKKSYRQI